MENLHHLTGCSGQYSLWMEQFHQTFHNLLTCLSCHPLAWCFSSQKELSAALAHRMMHSLPYLFFLPQLLWWYHANFVTDEYDTIVHFVHEVHLVFAVTLSTFLHMLCGWNYDTMPTVNLFWVHLKCFSISGSFSWKKSVNAWKNLFAHKISSRFKCQNT